MSVTLIIAVLAALSVFGYYLGRTRALAAAGGEIQMLRALPSYHGAFVVLWCAVPAVLVLALWLIGQPVVIETIVVAGLPSDIRGLPAERIDLLVNDIRNLASGGFVIGEPDPVVVAAADHLTRLNGLADTIQSVVVLAIAIVGLAWGRTRISARLPAREVVEKAFKVVLWTSSTIAILTTIGIVLSLLFESIRFFNLVPLSDFLFGIEWSPQTAIREDQVGAAGAFGMIPLFTGTLLITAIAMCVAVPVGLMSAVYLTDYAQPRTRTVVKPVLEILAGVPTVVYGFFAAITVAPFVREFGADLGLDVASESALAAGLVMGIMIIPFVSSLSDDVIHAVPQSLRDGALGLGSTKSETVKRVVLPAALPGIVGGVLLAVSRAIGETMIVVMAAGLAANLTANPLEAVTTVTVQIVTLLVGDQEFDSAKTLAAFALGLVLFAITLVLNVIALRVVRKYREQYE